MGRFAGLVGICMCASMVLAVLATRRAPVAATSPIVPPGGWNGVWVGAVCASFALYGLGVLLARSGRAALVGATVVAVVVQTLPLAAPLLLSGDVHLYWAQARVVTAHHANPYTVPALRFADDPATKVAAEQWTKVTEPYGPSWVGLGAVPALVAGNSTRASELLYRLIAFVGVLVCVVLVAWRTRSARSVSFLGWNPLVALHYAGGGHNDAWMVVALVLAVATRCTPAAGVAWTVGSGFKGVPAILLPLELARTRFRLPLRFWVALVGSGLAFVVVATALFGTGWVSASAVGAHTASPIGGVHFLVERGLRHRYAVVICGLVFVAIYAALFRHAWTTGRARLALAAVALCLLSSLLRPWYALWPVALAAIEADGPGEFAAYALSAYVLFTDAVQF
jgi:hypothetical protein